ncbi:KH domain-containing protein [Candidatus Dojkabacteria bacterium]|nr:KH domain-containing protein [Candidatus Dojkabacteria bacterium]
MQELLKEIVSAIVNNPDDVEISQKESVDFPGLVILKIKVNPDDLGIVIGKRGRTINAIRDLVTIAAIRSQQRVKVVVDEEGERAKPEDRKDADAPQEGNEKPAEETSEDLPSDQAIDEELGL